MTPNDTLVAMSVIGKALGHVAKYYQDLTEAGDHRQATRALSLLCSQLDRANRNAKRLSEANRAI